MPAVLHLLPVDAALREPGLEAWLDAGPGFSPVLAMARPTDRWRMFPQAVLSERPGRWERFKCWATREPWRASPWSEVLEREGVGLVHLHHLGPETDEVIDVAQHLGLPVVLSWPRGADAPVDWGRFARVLVPTHAAAERLQADGCPEARLRVAPVPLQGAPARRYVPPKGQPMLWAAACEEGDEAGLRLVIEAWEAFITLLADTRLSLYTGPAAAGWARKLAAPLGDRLVVEAVTSPEALRTGLAAAHAGLFPLVGGALDTGLSGPAWVAASLGLPLVLGREAAADGVQDHQQALLAAPMPGELARRMHFLAQRPYIWQHLGQSAAAFALGRLAFERAVAIPREVYRQVLAETMAEPKPTRAWGMSAR